jgi:hypothetical protein
VCIAQDAAGDASVLSLGAELSVVVESLGLSTGLRDSVVPLLLPGAVLLLLLPQAAALSAASPRRSASSVFRMGTSSLSVPGMGPIWVVRRAAPPRLDGTAPALDTVGRGPRRRRARDSLRRCG